MNRKPQRAPWAWAAALVAVGMVWAVEAQAGPGREARSWFALDDSAPAGSAAQMRPSALARVARAGPAAAISRPAERFVFSMPGLFISTVTGGDGRAYQQVTVPGMGSRGVTTTATREPTPEAADRIGAPQLPFRGFFMEVPRGVEVRLDIEQTDSVAVGRGFVVHPRQPPRPDSSRAPPPPFAISHSAYQIDALSPAAPVRIGAEGIIRGRRIVFIEVYPVQYNPVTTELRAHRTIRFSLGYVGQPTPADAREAARFSAPSFDSLTGRLIQNDLRDDASRGRPLWSGAAATDGDVAPTPPSAGMFRSVPSTGADYLIIAADPLVEAVLPLADWKRARGHRVVVLPISAVGATPTAVKDLIQTLYDAWNPAPASVLLVGDHQDIPAYSFTGQLPGKTDQIYSYVDGADYFPDLSIARLPVHTPAECATLVGKILAYDRDCLPGDWYSRFVAAAYFEDNDNDGVEDRWFMETAAHITEFLEGPKARLTGIAAWCTNSGPHSPYFYNPLDFPHRLVAPGALPAWIEERWKPSAQAGQAISDAIDAGVGLVYHRDHGSETAWGEPPFDVERIAALGNGPLTPVVFSMNCQTGSFHRSGGDCFCEAFLKHPNGGAVGAVGATRISYSPYNDLITNGMIAGLWPAFDPAHETAAGPPSFRPADALIFGKLYLYLYEGPGDYTEGEFNMFHWFGDPDMDLRTTSPAALTVLHPATVPPLAPAAIPITAAANGVPLSDARVALTGPLSGSEPQTATPLMFVAETDGAGAALFSPVHLPPGDYDLVVSHPMAAPCQRHIRAETSSTGTLALDRAVYSDADIITVFVTDADLTGATTQPVSFACDGGDSETLIVSEMSAAGVFRGTIPTAGGAPNPGDGWLQVAHDSTITATYQDAEHGGSGAAGIEDTARIDAQPPALMNVRAEDVRAVRALIAFESDEPTTALARIGVKAGGPYDRTVAQTQASTSHGITVEGLTPMTAYYYEVWAFDAAGNMTRDDNGGSGYAFETLEPIDYMTEIFTAGDNDLDNQTLTVTPDTSSSGYRVCRQTAAGYPTDPAGGLPLALPNDGYVEVALPEGRRIPFFGIEYDRFFVSSNGFITFGGGSSAAKESLSTHFNRPRISALFADLDPSRAGSVSWRDLPDRAAVTFDGIPRQGASNVNQFQIELFYNGMIRVTWLQLDATDGLAGLSAGRGIPSDFVESDLSGYGPCDELSVTPRYGFASVGYQGGPFTPSGKVFRIVNEGAAAHDWSATTDQTWLVAAPSSGTLAAGGQVDVTVSLDADLLAPGLRTATSTFRNSDSGAAWTRDMSLEILPLPGEIDVTDSFVPIDDQTLPFGAVVVGTSETARVTVANTHTTYGLFLEKITLGEDYREDFADGAAQGWQPGVDAQWTVDGGIYRARPGVANTFTASAYANGVWKDATIQTSIRRDADGAAVSILFARASSDFGIAPTGDISGAAYLLAVNDAAQFSVIRAAPSGTVVLRDWIRGQGLRSGPLGNDIALSLEGDSLSVFFNGQLAWSGADSAITEEGRIGLIAFSSASDTAHYFDNVTVTAPGGQDLPFDLLGLPALPASLAPGAEITFDVRYRPGIAAPHTGLLRVRCNDADEPEVSLILNGTGSEDDLRISPAGAWNAAGPLGGPFSPGAIEYAVSNAGGSSLEWTLEPLAAAWLRATPTTGALTAGESTSVTISIADEASSLGAGLYSSALVFISEASSLSQVRHAFLDVFLTAQIVVDVTTISVALPEGANTTRTLVIANGAGASEDLAATLAATGTTDPLHLASWLRLSPAEVTGIAPGSSSGITLTFDADARAPGLFEGAVRIASNDRIRPLLSVPVEMQVNPDDLTVSPTARVEASGVRGGPYSPDSADYVLTNTGAAPLVWSAATTERWLRAAPAGGALLPGASVTVSARLTSYASGLRPGSHSNWIRFRNESSGGAAWREFGLLVKPPEATDLIYDFPLDADPAWAREGEWAFGPPQGGGSFAGDPPSARTGTNVFGYNLAGDYPNNMPERYLTAGPFDFSRHANVTLRFWRWLGVDGADEATISASADGAEWFPIWGKSATVSDSQWSEQTYRLSSAMGAALDDQTSVVVRWGMGPSDAVGAYPGWNIDDVAFVGATVDDLVIAPSQTFFASGPQGGAPQPADFDYVLTNTGDSEFHWSVAPSSDASWLGLSTTQGDLASGKTTTVTVSITSAARALSPGRHDADLHFTRSGSPLIQTRRARLTVTPLHSAWVFW